VPFAARRRREHTQAAAKQLACCGHMEERGYSVIRALGHGGQGRVYEVRDARGQLCVVKQLPWLATADQERALLEVRLLSSLRHPCIVPYLDSFLARSVPSIPSEDLLCVVMCRCERDLRHACVEMQTRGERFEETCVISWLAQLCWGLQHLHARRFLHRDLKPQNVLLTHSGRALLADFGVAGHLEHTEDFKRSVVGTPAFMSPEMLEGRPYGCKTDIWALGCVLYEIMALEAPFVGCESYAAIVVAVLQSPPPRAPPYYSQELSTTLEALLARKPDSRPSSAELLAGTLLREPFRALLQSSADEVRAAATPTPREEADATDYESDFESYSGSDTESPCRPRADVEVPASNTKIPAGEWSPIRPDVKAMSAPALLAHSLGEAKKLRKAVTGEWRQLHIEAKALLQPVPALDPNEEAKKVRRVLTGTLGSALQVEKALTFLSERRPFCEADVADEMVLQIEIVDAFGEEGLQALPLLERCLVLEARL